MATAGKGDWLSLTTFPLTVNNTFVVDYSNLLFKLDFTKIHLGLENLVLMEFVHIKIICQQRSV